MKMRIAIILAVCAALAVAGGTAFAQGKQTMATGKHDLRVTQTSGDWCKACHTPHGGAAPVPVGLLWNHALSTTPTFQTWQSVTDFKGGTVTVSATTTTGLCLSCHDGSVALNSLYNGNATASVDSLYKAGPLTGGDLMGTDLRNDHPVGFVYGLSVTNKGAGNLSPAATVVGTGALKLFGYTTDAATGTMECGSCHDVHNNANTKFLRKSNTNSAMCITCHL